MEWYGIITDKHVDQIVWNESSEQIVNSALEMYRIVTHIAYTADVSVKQCKAM